MSLANQKLEVIAEVARVEAYLIQQGNLAGISTADLATITATLTVEINAAVDFDALDALNLGIEEALAFANTLARYASEGAAKAMFLGRGGGFVAVGTGGGDPKESLHIQASGTSGYAGAKRGVLITDAIGPRFVMEDTGETAGNRVMVWKYESQIVSLSGMADDGLSFDVENIIAATRDGQVGIGAAPLDASKLLIQAQTDQARLLRFDTERAWAFKQDGTGSSTALTLQSLNNQKNFKIQDSLGNNLAAFLAGTAPDIRLAHDQAIAKVGIGTPNAPAEKLELLGGSFLQHGGNAATNYTPTLVGNIPLLDGVWVKVIGAYAFVINTGTDGLRIVNVSDAANPVVVSTLAFGLSLQDADIAGRYLYVIDRDFNDETLFIVDVSNAAAPVIRGTLVLGQNPTSITVSGKYVYITEETAGVLKIVDVTDPDNPFLVSSPAVPTGFPQATTVSDGFAYVSGAGVTDFNIIDVTDPLTASAVGGLIIGSFAPHIEVSGKHVFLADQNPTPSRVHVIDVTDPSTPVIVGAAIMDVASLARKVKVSGDYLYVTDEALFQLWVFNISDRTAPVEVGRFTFAVPSFLNGMDIVGSDVYIADGFSDTFKIIDISGIDVQSATVHAFKAFTAQVMEDLRVGKNLQVRNGLNVGGPALFDGDVGIAGNLHIAGRNVVYVTDVSQLPAPVAGVITLRENTEYVFYNDDPTTSQKQINIADRIVIPDAGGCRITSVGLATVLLNYSGTGDFFTTSDNFTGFFSIDNIFISAPTGTLFNISGVLPVGQEFFPRLYCWSMGFFNTDTIGTLKNISFNFNIGAFFSCKNGLVVRNMREVLISDIRFTDWQNQSGAVMLTTYGTLSQPKIAGCVFETNANETVFDFQPNVQSDEQIIVAANVIRGAGTIFKSGSSGAITAVVNQSFSGAVIASVAGTPFGESLFTTTLAHNLVVGQLAIQAGFPDPNYNGVFPVLEVLSATQYRVHTLFTATGSGSLASDIIEITSTAHGRAVGDAVQITGSLDSNDYDGPDTVIDVFDVNTFQINRPFVATDTGANWNTDSLDQNSVNTKFGANTGVPDSKSRIAIIMNGNLSLTTTVDGTYGPLALTNLLVNPITARFRPINLAIGLFRYVGLDPVTMAATSNFNVVKVGSTEKYRFAAAPNGVPPTFLTVPPLEPHIAVEVRSIMVQAGGPSLVTLQPNNTIQFMVAGDGNADSLTVTDLAAVLQET